MADLRLTEGEMMYTVIRVTADGAKVGELDIVGESMNEVRPGVYKGIRNAGDGFSCEVCEDQDWDQHVQAISRFVGEFSMPLRRLVEVGAAVTFDVAVEPEDREVGGPVLVLRGDVTLLEMLARGGMALEVSIYG